MSEGFFIFAGQASMVVGALMAGLIYGSVLVLRVVELVYTKLHELMYTGSNRVKTYKKQVLAHKPAPILNKSKVIGA